VYDPAINDGGFLMHPRRFARTKPAGLVSTEAKILRGPKDPLITCRLLDYSAGGACVELGGQVNLPTRFELIHGTARKKCRVVWQRGSKLGLVF
jgi:PilZ domain-containing protein